MRDYYLSKEVSRILSVSEVSLSHWRRANPRVGPPCAKRGKCYHYPKNAQADYIENLTGGDPVPRNLSTEEKRKMFARLHRESLPPLETGPSRLALVAMIENLEKRLVRIEADAAMKRKRQTKRVIKRRSITRGAMATATAVSGRAPWAPEVHSHE
jgi:hypothetical protein